MRKYTKGNLRGHMLSYDNYYRQQAGDGISPHYFKGAPYQRGHGIGSFFGGLFRSVLPLLKKGGISIGKELLSSGMNVLNDIGDGGTLKESLNTRLGESANNLKRKATDYLTGKGRKRRRKTVKSRQSKKITRRRKTLKQSGKGKAKVGSKIRKRKSKQVGKGVSRKRKTNRKRKTVKKVIRRRKTNKRNKYDFLTNDIFAK